MTLFFNSPLAILAPVVSVAVACEIAYYVFKRLRNQSGDKSESKKNMSKVIFFPDASVVTSNTNGNVKTNSSFQCLIHHLSQAEKSLDVCVYIFSCNQLRQVVEKVHARGARVRVLIDESQSDASGSQIENMRRKSIRVRTSKGMPYLMHHKFAIVDNRVLINGSFNWTRQAVVGNRENLIITEDQTIVKPYVEEFDQLWNLFDPRNELEKV